VAMIEENGHTVARWPAPGWRVFRRCRFVSTRGSSISGGERVEAGDCRSGRAGSRTIACDGVIFTGGFLPAAELVRSSPCAWDSGSGGPVIDQFGRCSDPTYFAAGNLLRAVETAAGATVRATRRRVVADDLQGRLQRSRVGSS